MKMGNPNGLSMISVEHANEAFETTPFMLKDEEVVYDSETDARKSSNIKKVTYSWQDAKLTVAFTSGRTYEFYKVEPSTMMQFKDAHSFGTFFNRNIRGIYKYSEI